MGRVLARRRLWDDVAGFLAMGGYAAYVWPAFGFTVAVMAGLFAQSWRAARVAERELAELRATLQAGARAARRPSPGRPTRDLAGP